MQGTIYLGYYTEGGPNLWEVKLLDIFSFNTKTPTLQVVEPKLICKMYKFFIIR